jgi:hypothetical protein
MGTALLPDPAPEYVFSSRPGAPPVVAILPALDVVISVRLGDDPRPCQLLWELLTRSLPQPLPFVVDDRLGIGGPRPATHEERYAIPAAFESACLGPRQR